MKGWRAYKTSLWLTRQKQKNRNIGVVVLLLLLFMLLMTASVSTPKQAFDWHHRIVGVSFVIVIVECWLTQQKHWWRCLVRRCSSFLWCCWLIWQHQPCSSISCNPVSPESNVLTRTESSSCLYSAKPLLSPACECANVVTLVQAKYGQTCPRQGSAMFCQPHVFVAKYARRHRARLVHPNMFTHGHWSTCMSSSRRTGNALSHLTDCHMGWP